MKNIMITDMYWEKSAWTLHIHGTHVRLQCHSIFMYVNKLSVWGCGSHLRPHITEGEAWMQQSSSFLKAYHFPGSATRRWLSLGFNDFIFYHLRLRQFMATDWGEPCKRWVQHVPFRTLCNVRDQNNFSQGSLRSAMQGLKTQYCGLVSLWVSLGSQGELFLWSIIRCYHISQGLMMSPKERFKWWGSYEKWKGMGYYYGTVVCTISGDERTFHKILLDS